MKNAPVRIQIVQSNVTGCYGYCPVAALSILRPEYDDEANIPDVESAALAILRDKSVPVGSTIVRPDGTETVKRRAVPAIPVSAMRAFVNRHED